MAESPVNGVGTTLASACLSTDTTLSLTSATGFTNAQYHCLISDGTNYEIVLATALSGTTLTVTRAVEAYNGVTTAFAFASGSTINVVPTVASVVGLIEGQPYLTATGVGNATSATRYVGGTANGAPTSGTFAVGDFIIDQTGTIWVCTTAGTPGTWTTTISSHLSLRSASATVGRNEITLFSGSTASQTLTAPSNPIDGSNWTVINKSSVAITLSFTPSMIALGSSSGVTTFSVPANGSFSFVNYNGSQWYMVASNSATQLIGTLPAANGGTNTSTTTLGSLLVGNSGNTWTTVPLGSVGQMLTATSTYPQWQNVASNAVTSINGGTTGLTPSTATQGAVTLGGTLNVVNGGTGVTTSTGTGSVVLNLSPTLASPTITNSSGSYAGQATFSVGAAGGGGSVLISAPTTQSTNTVLNLPVVTTTPDTLATLAATQTLTNKTISGASNTLSNISLTTAVTGTLPVANGGVFPHASTGSLPASFWNANATYQTVDPTLLAANYNLFPPTKGVVYYYAIYLPAGISPSKIVYNIQTAGTSASCLAGLYNSTTQIGYTGTGVTTVGSTSLTLTATSAGSLTSLAGGVYFIGFLIINTSTTSPYVLATSTYGAQGALSNFGPVLTAGSLTTQTSKLGTGLNALPASISGTPTTATVGLQWLGLS